MNGIGEQERQNAPDEAAQSETPGTPKKTKEKALPRRTHTMGERKQRQELKRALHEKYAKKQQDGTSDPQPAPERERIQAALLQRQNRKTVAYAFRNAIKNSRVNTLIMLLVCIVLILFVVATARQDLGNFTISLNRRDMAKYGLSLSESTDFGDATDRLKAQPLDDATNISITDLPADVSGTDGGNNGKNYISYTFYIRNEGKQDADYRWAINVLSVSKNVDEAVRVAVYYNDTERVVYAKPAQNGGAEPGTVPFVTGDTVQLASVKQLKTGSADRYTVVIWLEGDDPDCVDALIGGTIRLGMNLSVDEEPKATQSIFEKLFGF